MNKTAALIAVISLAYAFIYAILLIAGVRFPLFFDVVAIFAAAYVGVYGFATTYTQEDVA